MPSPPLEAVPPPPSPAASEAAASELAAALADNLARVLKGKPEAVRLSLVALLAGAHLLIEDVPGVGKTLLAKALARSVGGDYGRIQATPDLLPGELTGVNVFHPGEGRWEFRPGPLFAHVVLVDEINRATPRTQSALLEAMEEGQVTVDGVGHPLPDPFLVVATQNPFEHTGTFPLVEGQLDRFGVVLHVGHPDAATERELLLGEGGTESLDELRPVTTPAGLRAAVAEVRAIHCEPSVADYVVAIANATRAHRDVVIGTSPRGTLGLLHAAKAWAAMEGRRYVVPDDVKALAVPVLAHRLVLATTPDTVAAGELVAGIVASVPAPR